MSATDTVLLVFGATSLFAVITTYGLYPLSMLVLSALRARPWKQDEQLLPPVTMVVAAHDEEAVIEEKLRNFLAIDYPADRLFLLVGSDGSVDRTDEILKRFDDGIRIRTFSYPQSGKMATVNRLMHEVRTPFVIFSDANTMYEVSAARRLMRHFADERVGGVCGNLLLRDASRSVGSSGERTYWSYENLLKKWEGRAISTLGATGGIYAIRSEMYEAQPEAEQVADDLLLPMRIVSRGGRFVYDDTARAVEETMPSMRGEFRRKIRVGVGTFNTMRHIRLHASEIGTGIKSMFFLHKFLRWIVPFFILIVLFSALGLSDHGWVRYYLLAPAAVIIILGLAGWLAEMSGRSLGRLSLPFYFLAINLALLIAWYRFLFQKSSATWERRGG